MHLIKNGGLLVVVLENVAGTMQNLSECPNFMRNVKLTLSRECPEFSWSITVANTEDYQVPHHRVRAYLRGLRRTVGALPPPLPAFGRKKLIDFLDLRLPNARRCDLGNTRRKNLRRLELQVACALASGKILPGQLAVVAIDRAQGKVYKVTIFLDRAPTLTTRNWFLFVFSVEDLHKLDKDRRVFRWLAPSERLRLQGAPDSDASLLTACAARHAAGNSFSAPTISAMLAPLLDALGRMPAGTLFAWPPPGLADGVVGSLASNFVVDDGSPPDGRRVRMRV